MNITDFKWQVWNPRPKELTSQKYGWFNKTNAARYLGVSLPTFNKWIDKFGIPYTSIDGVKRYGKEDLDNFMREHK